MDKYRQSYRYNYNVLMLNSWESLGFIVYSLGLEVAPKPRYFGGEWKVVLALPGWTQEHPHLCSKPPFYKHF